MSIETAVLALVVFGGAAAVMILSFVLAKCADEARRNGARRPAASLRKREAMKTARNGLGLLLHACVMGASLRLDYARHRAGLSPEGR